MTKVDKDEKKKIKIKAPEYQFFSKRERLIELLTKQAEWESNKKSKSRTTAASTATAEKTDETRYDQDKKDKMQEEDKEKELSENCGLTSQEFKEKQKLLNTGSLNWTKDEYLAFVKACEKYGRKEFSKISKHIGTKTPEEVAKYSKVFWARITELPDYQKHVKNIERGEVHLQSRDQAREIINNKCASFGNPKEEMEFNPTYYNRARSKSFSVDHDKFLVYISHIEGYGNWDKIKRGIKDESLFRFDHFFKSRTEADLNKRMQSLLKVLEKEKETSTLTKHEEGEHPAQSKSPSSLVMSEESDEEQFNIKKKTPSTGKEKTKKEGQDKKDKEKTKEKEKRAKSNGHKEKEKDQTKDKTATEGSREKGKPSMDRDERYKERQAQRQRAELKKLGVMIDEEEGSQKNTKKRDRKLKQTSILSFGQSGISKTTIEPPAKASKKRKINNISSPQKNRENQVLKMTKFMHCDSFENGRDEPLAKGIDSDELDNANIPEEDYLVDASDLKDKECDEESDEEFHNIKCLYISFRKLSSSHRSECQRISYPTRLKSSKTS